MCWYAFISSLVSVVLRITGIFVLRITLVIYTLSKSFKVWGSPILSSVPGGPFHNATCRESPRRKSLVKDLSWSSF